MFHCFRHALVLLIALPVLSRAALLDFEELQDQEVVTTQYSASGVTFNSFLALQSGAIGGSLNESEFPPYSDFTIIAGTSNLSEILFSRRLLSFSAYFTYTGPITVTAFDGNAIISSASSQFGTNLAFSGDPGSSPNELFSLNLPTGADRIAISADGIDYTLDNLNFVLADPAASVPEPSALLLTGGGFALLIRRSRHRRN